MAFTQLATSQVLKRRILKWEPSVGKLLLWEIAHLGLLHLDKGPWEVAAREITFMESTQQLFNILIGISSCL